MILCDNQSCIKMMDNPMFHDKSNHIEIRYHYINDMVLRGVIKLQYVGTYEPGYKCVDQASVSCEV
jgi:hypothetical protein